MAPMNAPRCTLALCFAPVVLAACAPLISWPPIEGDAAIHDLAVEPAPSAMAASIRAVSSRWPVDGPWLISPPEGTTLRTARSIIAAVDHTDANLAGPRTTGLPAFHITRVWIRGDDAVVDVFRPAASSDVLRKVTVRLHSRLARWRIESMREWPEGAYPQPTLNGWFGVSRFAYRDGTAQPATNPNPRATPAPPAGAPSGDTAP